MPRPTILWFRYDLRLEDNRALLHAAASGGAVVPLFVLDDTTPGQWRAGGASRWWLHHSLGALARELDARGSRLILRRGVAADVVAALAQEIGASAVHVSRAYQPWAVTQERALKERLGRAGLDFRRFAGTLMFEPEAVKTKDGGPFKVYTPFWRAATASGEVATPEAAPKVLTTPGRWPKSDTLAQWALRPKKPDWAGGLADTWTPGEAGAALRLSRFLKEALGSYGEDRNRPDREAVSRLSPHLAFGEISPATVWHAAHEATRKKPSLAQGLDVFRKELGWREFSYHLLTHWPTLPDAPVRPEFAKFPWDHAPDKLRAWQQGLTGYPIVDAGMRELWHTGSMHNRVRMIVASFLVKDLLVPWQTGEAWFWDTLVDADLANNAASWQWVSGSGADAAPYFRVFNPTLQGAKFDPEGAYVRTWVPELAKLPNDVIHRPWEAGDVMLQAAGLALGRDYPSPIVDHGVARERALAAFKRLESFRL